MDNYTFCFFVIISLFILYLVIRVEYNPRNLDNRLKRLEEGFEKSLDDVDNEIMKQGIENLEDDIRDSRGLKRKRFY